MQLHAEIQNGDSVAVCRLHISCDWDAFVWENQPDNYRQFWALLYHDTEIWNCEERSKRPDVQKYSMDTKLQSCSSLKRFISYLVRPLVTDYGKMSHPQVPPTGYFLFISKIKTRSDCGLPSSDSRQSCIWMLKFRRNIRLHLWGGRSKSDNEVIGSKSDIEVIVSSLTLKW